MSNSLNVCLEDCQYKGFKSIGYMQGFMTETPLERDVYEINDPSGAGLDQNV